MNKTGSCVNYRATATKSLAKNNPIGGDGLYNSLVNLSARWLDRELTGLHMGVCFRRERIAR